MKAWLGYAGLLWLAVLFLFPARPAPHDAAPLRHALRQRVTTAPVPPARGDAATVLHEWETMVQELPGSGRLFVLVFGPLFATFAPGLLLGVVLLWLLLEVLGLNQRQVPRCEGKTFSQRR